MAVFRLGPEDASSDSRKGVWTALGEGPWTRSRTRSLRGRRVPRRPPRAHLLSLLRWSSYGGGGGVPGPEDVPRSGGSGPIPRPLVGPADPGTLVRRASARPLPRRWRISPRPRAPPHAQPSSAEPDRLWGPDLRRRNPQFNSPHTHRRTLFPLFTSA